MHVLGGCSLIAYELCELLHMECVERVVQAAGSTQGGRHYSACLGTVHASLDSHKSRRCW